MIPLILLMSIPLLFILAVCADLRGSRADDVKSAAEAAAQLEKERKKPRYQVHVITKSGLVYRSPFIEPAVERYNWIRGWTIDTYSSESLAKRLIEASFKSGRYHHEANETFVPVCEIELMHLVAEEKK
jgi:hypothetical protein